MYAPQSEIRAYLEWCADTLDVRRHVRFGHEVVSAAWDERRVAWRVSTRAGEHIEARVLVLATGALANPAVPAFTGIERFRGACFHSARWDHDYEVRRKRVAVVGTGASAIQIVPSIQPEVARLYVVQRTPPWILPRRDRVFARWERVLLGALPAARWLYRQWLYWTLDARVVGFERPGLMRAVGWRARRHMERSIRDPSLRAKLTPSHRAGCKRILLSDDYYPAIARPNVEVVTDAVRGVTEHALVVDGRSLEVDAIVLATGFEVHDYLGGLACGLPGLAVGVRVVREHCLSRPARIRVRKRVLLPFPGQTSA